MTAHRLLLQGLDWQCARVASEPWSQVLVNQSRLEVASF